MQSEVKEENQLKLQKIRKEKNLCRVFFNDESSLLCNEDDIFEYKLYKDSSISKEVFERLQAKNNYYECLNDAIRIVNTKFFAAKQVKDRLIKLNHYQEDIDNVINYLKEKKIIDDDAFFDSYVEFKVRQGYGSIYIKNKLFDLGINRNIEIPYEVQYELIKTQLLKKKTKKENYHVFTKKFMNKMIGQGFDNSIISDVINETKFESNDEKIKEDYDKLKIKYQKKYEGYQLAQVIKQRMLAKGYLLSEIETIMEEGV